MCPCRHGRLLGQNRTQVAVLQVLHHLDSGQPLSTGRSFLFQSPCHLVSNDKMFDRSLGWQPDHIFSDASGLRCVDFGGSFILPLLSLLQSTYCSELGFLMLDVVNS